MRIKKGTIIKIVRSVPTESQDELDLNHYIGLELPVLAHWQQTSNCLEDGEVQVELPDEGIIVLNKNEYEVVQ